MPSMVRYKDVSGDISEAGRIARLLQEEVDKDFEELRKDIPQLTERLNVVRKWNDVVRKLTPPPQLAPASDAATQSATTGRTPRTRSTATNETKPPAV